MTEWLVKQFQKRYEIKHQIMGDATDLDKQVKVLNRTPKWTEAGIVIEADPRHAVEVIKALGLENDMSVSTPGVPAEGRKSHSSWPQYNGKTQDEGDEPLIQEEMRRYRAVAARLNYLSQDRPDIRFATMDACGGMAAPTQRHLNRLKRIGRYLLGRQRAEYPFRWQEKQEVLHSYTDSDWAGDKVSRRSTSAGCLMRGTHCVKTWSKRQQVIALSSAEAELYAGLRTAVRRGPGSAVADMRPGQ